MNSSLLFRIWQIGARLLRFDLKKKEKKKNALSSLAWEIVSRKCENADLWGKITNLFLNLLRSPPRVSFHV